MRVGKLQRREFLSAMGAFALIPPSAPKNKLPRLTGYLGRLRIDERVVDVECYDVDFYPCVSTDVLRTDKSMLTYHIRAHIEFTTDSNKRIRTGPVNIETVDQAVHMTSEKVSLSIELPSAYGC